MTETPDAAVKGLIGREADPLRYGGGNPSKYESPGLIRAMTPRGVRLLDVGCGVGAITSMINKDKNNSVLCLEPDPRRAAAAAARGLDVLPGPLDAALVRRRGPFDVIIFSDVLEHLSDPGQMLDSARAALTPSGMVIASTPNVAHWTVRMNLLIGRFDYEESGIMDATHLRFFTKKSLCALFRSHGFEVMALKQAPGNWMKAYDALPWRLLPRKARSGLVIVLSRWWPGMFAAQFVMSARIA
jgi:2-polyprenyl-3-methyl-5-hydroxy-6-metoxy-1,4-benzoquinol methylase